MITKRGTGDFPRIYRPCRISEVYGQDEITSVIGNELDEGTLAHSLLFYGVSGTGKTTVGRIIAMGLNCEKGPTSEPCCECNRCRPTMAGNSLAFQELDSARYNGIDHIRQLGSEFCCAPLDESPKKVVLFDECHRLTEPAQNALLKIVEDSWEHLHIIFCSTEYDKIIPTLRNRCMQFEFKPVPDGNMWELLIDVCLDNDIKPDTKVLADIMKKAQGMPRNALWEFQKAMKSGQLVKWPINFHKMMERIRERFSGRDSKPDKDVGADQHNLPN